MLRAPHGKAPGLAAGITESMIRDLVHDFYAKVRHDGVLGPIFAARIHDWDAHLAKLCAFWSSVALMTGRYKGRPMPVHAAIEEISEAHFERWLGLFRDTARSNCPPPRGRTLHRPSRTDRRVSTPRYLHPSPRTAALEHERSTRIVTPACTGWRAQ